MAVLAVFKTKITKPQYETLRKEVGWEKKHPNGALFHSAAFDEAGNLTVADVWESAELMGAFVETRLKPSFQKNKIAPPDVSVLPLHNINAYPALDKHKLKA